MTLVTHLAHRLRAIANWKTLTISGVVFVLAAGILFASSASFSLPTVYDACGQDAPDVRFYTSAGELDEFLTECGTDGRTAYRNLQLADLVYPAIAGLFPALALAVMLDRLRHERPGNRDLTVLALLPLLGAAFDYLENAIAWTALAAYPEDSPVASLFGIAAVGKQSLNWASWMLLVAGLVLTGRRLVQRRRSRRPARHELVPPAHPQRPAIH